MEWKEIAKIGKAHSLQGEVEAIVFAGERSLLNSRFSYRLNENPVKIQSIRWKVDRALIKFEGIQDRTQAEALRGQILQIHRQHLQSQKNEIAFLSEFIGFRVLDQLGANCGVVTAFEGNGAQDLIVLDQGFSIPFVDELVIRVDWDQRELHMHVPEGLRDINKK